MTSRAASARLVIITAPDAAAGFRFAGASVVPVTSSDEAQHAVAQVLDEGERGVIAIHEPYYDDFDAQFRRRCDEMVAPIVLPLPMGTAVAASDRRARLTEMLQRVIGYQISFEEPERFGALWALSFPLESAWSSPPSPPPNTRRQKPTFSPASSASAPAFGGA